MVNSQIEKLEASPERELNSPNEKSLSILACPYRDNEQNKVEKQKRNNMNVKTI